MIVAFEDRNLKMQIQEAQNSKKDCSELIERMNSIQKSIIQNSFFISFLSNCDYYKDFFILHQLSGAYSRQYQKEQKKCEFNNTMIPVLQHLRERLHLVFLLNKRSKDYRSDPVLILKRCKKFEQKINNLPYIHRITVF